MNLAKTNQDPKQPTERWKKSKVISNKRNESLTNHRNS